MPISHREAGEMSDEWGPPNSSNACLNERVFHHALMPSICIPLCYTNILIFPTHSLLESLHPTPSISIPRHFSQE